MRELDKEQQGMVRDLIYRYCEIQKTMNTYSSAVDACMKSYWMDIIKTEKALGIISDDND